MRITLIRTSAIVETSVAFYCWCQSLVTLQLTLSVSLIEALVILPAHIAHSKALDRKRLENGEEKKKNGIDAFFSKINKTADVFLMKIRDTYYLPFLKFCLNNKIFAFSIPVASPSALQGN